MLLQFKQRRHLKPHFMNRSLDDMTNQEKIHWGVIGTANIARAAVIPAIQASRNGKITAVASGILKRQRTLRLKT